MQISISWGNCMPLADVKYDINQSIGYTIVLCVCDKTAALSPRLMSALPNRPETKTEVVAKRCNHFRIAFYENSNYLDWHLWFEIFGIEITLSDLTFPEGNEWRRRLEFDEKNKPSFIHVRIRLGYYGIYWNEKENYDGFWLFWSWFFFQK